MQQLRILLADDHALFRDGIASLLRAWQLNLVGEASDGAQAVEQARKLIADHRLRKEIMAANSLYYRAHLRPDALMLNSLLAVMSRAS